MSAKTELLKAFFNGHFSRQSVKKVKYEGNKSGRIVFNTVGCYLNDLSIEFALAHLMAISGYEVTVLLDDFQMPHWEYIQNTSGEKAYLWHHSFKNKAMKRAYATLATNIFKHKRLKYLKYSKILPLVEQPPLQDSDHHHAESSVRRYFQMGEANLRDPSQKEYFDVSLKNCEISKRVGRFVVEKLKPDLFVTSHGIYSTFGPAYDYVSSHGILSLVFGINVYQKQKIFLFDSIEQFMSASKSWREFSSKPLSAQQRQMVLQYYSDRFAGRSEDTSLYFSKTDDSKKFMAQTENVYGLFPNVIWDADIHQRNILFEGPVEWVVETIKFFESKPDLHLLIRFHPSEATLMSYTKKLEPIIRKKIPHLDQIKNITIISSDENVKTYDLLKNIKVGLVYEGALGLELPFLKIPVITTARARYAGAGNSFEPKSKQEYFEMLADPAGLVEKFNGGEYHERALQFSYWYFFEAALPFPALRPLHQGFGFMKPLLSRKDLDPAINQELHKTLDYISAYV